MLTFSVSKNSGRITLHYKEDGSSSLINFDVHDVLTEETVDALADAQTTRVNAIATSVNLQFNQEAIQGGACHNHFCVLCSTVYFSFQGACI